MVGEKYLNPDFYENSQDFGDDDGALIGLNYDSVRWTTEEFKPRQDQRDFTNYSAFGSPHQNGWQAALCDGSVRVINYDIDYETYWRLGARNDGQLVDMTGL